MTDFDHSISAEHEQLADPVIHPSAELRAADDALAQRVEALRKTIADLSPVVSTLQTEQATVWTWLKSGGVLIAFDLLVTIVGVLFGIYLHHVQNSNQTLITQVSANQTRLNVSIHETCNLYGMFESFYSPAARDRFVGGPVLYDKLYIQLQNSSDHLQCGLKHVVPGT